MDLIDEEIEVLSSIFASDLAKHGEVWGYPKISVVVKPHMSQGRDPVEAELEITYVAGYPKKSPSVKVVRSQGISEENAKLMQQMVQRESMKLAAAAEEPFVFDLTRLAQDFLVSHRVVTKSFYEEFQEEETNRTKLVQAKKKLLQEQEAQRNASLNARVNRALEAPASPALKPQMWNVQFVSKTSQGEDGFDEAEPDLDRLLERTLNSKSRYQSDFEEIKLLGFGGFGKVVKARNRLDGRLYAVKRIKLERRDANSNRKTLREVTSLAKMFHQNIVRYYQAWIEDDDGNDSSDSDEEEDEWGEFSDSESSSHHGPKKRTATGTTTSSPPSPTANTTLDLPGLYQDANFGFGDWSDDDHDASGDEEDDEVSQSQTSNALSQQKQIRDRVLYIQMEYCPGQTLRDVIDKNILTANPDLVWRLLRQIVEALWYIHDTCHFIHRDLKPANVFLDENGNVKLGDFGLAVTVTGKTDSKHQSPNSAIPDLQTVDSGRVSPPHRVAGETASNKNHNNKRKTNPPHTKKLEESPPTISSPPLNRGNSIENTSGVGTTLYRAPEVSKGKYDEKCDMWSLGVMLYEMLVPPFDTGMERIRTLTELRETGKVSTDVSIKREGKELVEMLLKKRPKNRPSALYILESGRLPQKIETEQKYFDEVMRVVKGSDRSLPLYTRLMETLFTQSKGDEVFYTYDADILKYTNSGFSSHSDLATQTRVQLRQHETLHATQKVIYREMEKEFELFGASPFYAPLLTPKTDVESGRQNLYCQLMDPQGTIVLLPMNLTRPFARWIALRQLSWMKRYDCSRVYVASEMGNNLLGGQPRSKLQSTLDFVVPISLVLGDKNFATAWHADVIRCSTQAILRCSKQISSSSITVFIHDSRIQEALIQKLGLGERANAMQILSFLDSLFSNDKLNWSQVRKKCLEKLNQKQTDSLRPLFNSRRDNDFGLQAFLDRSGLDEKHPDVALRVSVLRYLINSTDLQCVFRPWLAPIPDMNSGLYYAIVVKRPRAAQEAPSSPSSQSQHGGVRKKRNNSSNGASTSSSEPTVCTMFQSSQSFVAGTGGRYDSLIRQYQLASVQKTTVAALGTRFHVERIAQQLINPVVDVTPCSTIVLVAAPSDEEPTSVHECAQIADQLRSHGIGADWMHPFPTDPANAPISETFVNYARVNRIPFFVVFKRKGQLYRIRASSNAGLHRDFAKFDQLVNFIKSKLVA